MSNIVSALEGASYAGLVTIEEAGLRGMITLRCDLASAAVKKAASSVAGVDLPGQGLCNSTDDSGIAWMSPDELLIMTPYADAPAAVEKLTKALAKSHALVANVSDARAVFTIRGAKGREVLSKLAPVDLSPDNFAPGQFRRTRLAQVPAAFWMRDAETFELICFRSVADYMFNLLSNAAKPGSGIDLY